MFRLLAWCRWVENQLRIALEEQEFRPLWTITIRDKVTGSAFNAFIYLLVVINTGAVAVELLDTLSSASRENIPSEVLESLSLFNLVCVVSWARFLSILLYLPYLDIWAADDLLSLICAYHRVFLTSCFVFSFFLSLFVSLPSLQLLLFGSPCFLLIGLCLNFSVRDAPFMGCIGFFCILA